MAQRDLAVRLGLDSREFTQGMNSIVKNTKDMERGISGIGNSITNLKRLAVAGFAGWGIQRVGREFLQAGIEVDRMTRAMTAITGSAKLAKGELEFLRKESNRLGLVFQDQLQSYILMSSAMKNTTLEGKGMRDMFSNIGEAATALQLPAERVKLIFYALQQMMNKGVVTMEELKRQMGDSLPGAFRIAAETAGVTLAEFTKLVEQGKVISEDFLPKFSKKIAEELGSGWKIGAESARMEMNKLKNTWFDVRKRIMEGGITDEFASTIRSINKAMAGWIDANEELIKQDVAHYIDEIKNTLDRLNGIAADLGPDIVGAAGKGLVGKLLFGGAWGWWAAAFLGIKKIADLLDDMAKKSIDVKKQFDAISNMQRGGGNWFNFDFSWDKLNNENLLETIVGVEKLKSILDESLTFDITKGFFDASANAKMLNDELLETVDLTNKAGSNVNTLAEKTKTLKELTKEWKAMLKEMDEEGWYSPDPFQYEDAAEKIKKMNAATEAYLKGREKSEEDALAAAKDAMDEQAEYWKHTIERIQDFTSDTLYDLFQGEIDDWQDMVDRMKDIFLKGLAEIIAKAATQNIIVPILAQVVGAFSSSAGNAILNAAGSANSGVGIFNAGSSAVSAGSNLYQGYNWLTSGGPANFFSSSTPAYGAASGSAAAGDVAAGAGFGESALAMGPYAVVLAAAVGLLQGVIGMNEAPESVAFFPGQTKWNEGALDYTSPYPYYRGQYEANNQTGFAPYGPTDPNEQITWYQGGEGGGGPSQTYPRWSLNKNHLQEGGYAQQEATDAINQMMADVEVYYGDFFSSLSDEAFEAFTASLDNIDVDWSLGWVKPETGQNWNEFFSAKLAEIQEAIMPAVIGGLVGWAENIDLSLFSETSGLNTKLQEYLSALKDFQGMSGEEILGHADEISALVNSINELGVAAQNATNYYDAINQAIEDVINPLSAFDKAVRDLNAQFDQWISDLVALGVAEEEIAEIEAKRAGYIEAATDALREEQAVLRQFLEDSRTYLTPRSKVNLPFDPWDPNTPGHQDGTTPAGASPATSLWELISGVIYAVPPGGGAGTVLSETQQILDGLILAFNDSMRSVIDTWNDFNAAMNSSSLAPVQSMEYFQNTFDALSADVAAGVPGAFGDLTDFVTSEFAPWMQDFGGDYNDWWTDIMGEVGGIGAGLQEGMAADSGLSPNLVSAIISAIETGGNRPIVIEIDGKQILYATMQQIEDGDPYAMEVLKGVMN